MAKRELISNKKIQGLRDQLKSYSKKWVSKVAIRMSTKADQVDAQKVYNIVNDVIRDNEWRNRFVKAANELIEEFKQEQVV